MQNVHAIGDRANSVVLDAFEHSMNQNTADLRPRLEHAQMLMPLDILRMGRLGGKDSVRCSHANS